MNRNEARKLAETVTNEQLNEMFSVAQSSVKDWHETSRVNAGMTKGAAFNILSKGFGKDFDPKKSIHVLAKTNMLREFGEFLPGYEKPVRKEKTTRQPFHRDPDFIDF